MNEIPRPEFSKLQVICKKRYEGDIEEENRLRKLNLLKKGQKGSQ